MCLIKRYEEKIEKEEEIFQDIVNKLDNYKNIASIHGVEINATNVHTTHGILQSDFDFTFVEEHNLSDLLGVELNLGNFKYSDFTDVLYENLLNYEEVTENLNFYRDKFFKGEIDQFRIRNILYKRNDELLYLDISVSSLKGNSFIIFVDDVTDYVKDKLLLEEFALHNNILVKEVHHRVKNNLQILLSLISLQQRFGFDENTLSEYMKLSISSMALIHDQLYADNLNYVSLENIIEDYKININNLYGDLGIHLIFETEENVRLSIDKSNPLFLILNELIISSFKYAFDDSQEDKIIKCLFKREGDCLIITYSDNGKGDNNGNDEKSGFGHVLVESLISQIDGKYKISSKNGFFMEMKIPIN